MSWLDTLLKVAKPVAEVALAASAKKQAGRATATATAKADATQAERLDLARQNQGNAQMLLDRYTNTYAPLENQLIQEASRPGTGAIAAGKAAADAESQAAVARGSMSRALSRRGVSANSGAAVDAERQLALGTVLNRTAATTNARRAAAADRFQKLAAISRAGAGLPGMAAGFSGMAGSGLSAVMNSRDQALADAGQVEGAAGQQFGDSLSGGLDLILKQLQKSRIPTTPTTASNYTGFAA